MVRLSYCQNCQKAYRFHFKRRLICRKCREPYEAINVPRSKFFILQTPFLIVGLILIFYAIGAMSIDPERFSEPLGVFFFGFVIVLIALVLQLTDNERMEKAGRELGMEKFGADATDPSSKITDSKYTQLTLPSKGPLKKKRPKESTKTEKLDQLDGLFSQPNKPRGREMKPKPLKDLLKETGASNPVRSKPLAKRTPVQIKLEDLGRPKSKKKPARKIRRAI
jgi:hypothetical protein